MSRRYRYPGMTRVRRLVNLLDDMFLLSPDRPTDSFQVPGTFVMLPIPFFFSDAVANCKTKISTNGLRSDSPQNHGENLAHDRSVPEVDRGRQQ
jgi:hypothetical protein